MGCCYSKDDDKSSQPEDATEHTRLLGNPVGNTSNHPTYSSGYQQNFKSSTSPKGDEQSALNRILLQTASNVIDVSAMDSLLEQQEYRDRVQQYSQKVNKASQEFNGRYRKPCLLADLPMPEKILSADPLSYDELHQINDISDKVIKALQELKVEHKEDLVVQFGAA